MEKYGRETFEEQQRWDKVREILFANDKQASSFACEVWKLLALNPATTKTDNFSLTEETLIMLKIEFLISGRGITDIADAILAIAIFAPSSCIKWLKCLAQGIDIGAKEKNDVKEAIAKGSSNYGSGDFSPGFIMGVFKVANWLYANLAHPQSKHEKWLEAEKPKLQMQFEKYFPGLVKETITCAHSTVQWAHRIFCKGQYESSSLSDAGKKFEGQLTTLIRSFVNEDTDENPVRQKLLEACVLAVMPNDAKNLSWPGEILLNQLLYTVFKVVCLKDRHEDIRNLLLQKETEKN